MEWKKYSYNNPNISYVGKWCIISDIYFSVAQTTEPSKFKFNFTGSSIRLTGYVSSDGNPRDTHTSVSIDGNIVGYINYKDFKGSYADVIFERTDLINKEHCCIVEASSKDVWLSLIDISVDSTKELKSYKKLAYYLLKENGFLFSVKDNYYDIQNRKFMPVQTNNIKEVIITDFQNGLEEYIISKNISNEAFRPIDKFNKFNLIIKK